MHRRTLRMNIKILTFAPKNTLERYTNSDSGMKVHILRRNTKFKLSVGTKYTKKECKFLFILEENTEKEYKFLFRQESILRRPGHNKTMNRNCTLIPTTNHEYQIISHIIPV